MHKIKIHNFIIHNIIYELANKNMYLKVNYQKDNFDMAKV